MDIANTIMKTPKYAYPLAIGGSALIMKLHIFRKLRKFVLPSFVAAFVYRTVYATDSEGILTVILNIVNSYGCSKCARDMNDALGLMLCLSAIQLTSSTLSMRLRDVKKYFMDFGYDIVKHIPSVQQQLSSEKAKLEEGLEGSIKKKSRQVGEQLSRLPAKGMEGEAIIQLMSAVTHKENEMWQDGKASGMPIL
jgi:hypothetical protein